MSVRVAMTGDSLYLYPLAVSMHSLARFGPRDVVMDYALPSDWTKMVREEEVEYLARLASAIGWAFRVVECPIEASGLPRTLHISPITFVKPAYFDVADAEICLFIDADSVAVSPWGDMAEMINDHAISAARENNMGGFERRWNPELPSGWYINAGMLVCRPNQWRQRYTERWRYLLKTYDKWDFHLLEQDIMNATLRGEADLLPNVFNVRPNYGHPLDGARIVHFAGWWKPWYHLGGMNAMVPRQSRTSFSMYRSAERSFWNFVHESSTARDVTFWEEARKGIRGSRGERAAQHYLRGSLSRIKGSWNSRRQSAD